MKASISSGLFALLIFTSFLAGCGNEADQRSPVPASSETSPDGSKSPKDLFREIGIDWDSVYRVISGSADFTADDVVVFDWFVYYTATDSYYVIHAGNGSTSRDTLTEIRRDGKSAKIVSGYSSSDVQVLSSGRIKERSRLVSNRNWDRLSPNADSKLWTNGSIGNIKLDFPEAVRILHDSNLRIQRRFSGLTSIVLQRVLVDDAPRPMWQVPTSSKDERVFYLASVDAITGSVYLVSPNGSTYSAEGDKLDVVIRRP